MKPSLNDLPVEILRMIMGMLPVKTLRRARLVSKDWKLMVDDPLLWERFHLNIDPEMAEETILKILTSRPSLLSVRLKDFHLTDEVLEAMVVHPALQKFHVTVTERGRNKNLSFARIYELFWCNQLVTGPKCQNIEQEGTSTEEPRSKSHGPRIKNHEGSKTNKENRSRSTWHPHSLYCFNIHRDVSVCRNLKCGVLLPLRVYADPTSKIGDIVNRITKMLTTRRNSRK